MKKLIGWICLVIAATLTMGLWISAFCQIQPKVWVPLFVTMAAGSVASYLLGRKLALSDQNKFGLKKKAYDRY